MDEYFDHYVSSSSWSDVNATERSSWGCGESDKPDRLLSNSLGIFENVEKESPVSMISSSHTVECLAAQDTSSIVLGGESDYGVENGLLYGAARLQNDGEICNGYSSNGILNSRLKVGNMAQYTMAIPSPGSYTAATPSPISLNQGSPKHLAAIGDVTSVSFTKMGHFSCNGTELSEVPRPLRDLPTISLIPQLFPPSSDDGAYSLSNVMGQDRMQGFGLQGGNSDNDIGNRYVEMNKILQLDNFSASITTKGVQDLQNNPLPSFAAGPQITVTTAGLPSLLQTTSSTPAGGCNGTGKPRVRARRGQATDPHSIAERLRREKIAERMKNLQELVPNSNKTDKASMLDEIIEYVKFLQLQVKVLSMSRLGAAGAVVPLITDGQAEGSNGLSLLPSVGQGLDISPSADQIAFEQEVVKLMESNVTMAMQYLQSKGLCLMPIALAAAISSRKASSVGTASEEKEKFGFTNGLVHNNSSSSSNSNLSGLGLHQMSSDSNIMIGKLNKEGLIANSCDRTVKQEEVKNILCTASTETQNII